MEKVLRAYASALVVMRQFYDRIAKGKTVMPQSVGIFRHPQFQLYRHRIPRCLHR